MSPLQAVLPSLQDGHHGPGPLHILPTGMAGGGPPEPHRFLLGKPAAPAGTLQPAHLSLFPRDVIWGKLFPGTTSSRLSPQVYTAVYYVLADLVMLSLYCYYKAKNQGRGCEFWLKHGGMVLTAAWLLLPG